MKSYFMQGVVVASILFILPGCGPRSTHSFPKLNSATTVVVPNEKRNVFITAHCMSHAECAAYFGEDLGLHGYQPLVLTLENKSLNSYTLRPSYLALPRVSGKEISRLMHYDTYQRVVWLTLPALFFWWPAIPIFIVPYGMACRHYNDKTTRNIRKKTWGRTETIYLAPHELVQKFIFVSRESFRSHFDLKLYNETTQVIELFHVDCVGC